MHVFNIIILQLF